MRGISLDGKPMAYLYGIDYENLPYLDNSGVVLVWDNAELVEDYKMSEYDKGDVVSIAGVVTNIWPDGDLTVQINTVSGVSRITLKEGDVFHEPKTSEPDEIVSISDEELESRRKFVEWFGNNLTLNQAQDMPRLLELYHEYRRTI